MCVTPQPRRNFYGTGWTARDRIFVGLSAGCWSSTRCGSAFADADLTVRFPAPPPMLGAAFAAPQACAAHLSFVDCAFGSVHSGAIPGASTLFGERRAFPSHRLVIASGALRKAFVHPRSIPGASILFGPHFVGSSRRWSSPFLHCAKPPCRNGRFPRRRYLATFPGSTRGRRAHAP